MSARATSQRTRVGPPSSDAGSPSAAPELPPPAELGFADEFGRSELQSVAERWGLTLAELLGHATRYSLWQSTSRPAFRWARKVCKSFGDALERASIRETSVRLELSEDVWRSLADIAERHRLPVERLVEYAGLHLLADLERGRVSERDLARGGDHGAAVELPQH